MRSAPQEFADRSSRFYWSTLHAASRASLLDMVQAAQARHRSDGQAVVRLSARGRRLYAVTSIDAAHVVLGQPGKFSRPAALVQFREAFELDSVFTTDDEGLHSDLRAYFAKAVCSAAQESFSSLQRSMREHAIMFRNEAMRTGELEVSFSLEAAVLNAFLASFFEVSRFDLSEELCRAIRRVWVLKSRRHNLLSSYWNPVVKLSFGRARKDLRELVRALEQHLQESNSRAWQESIQTYSGQGLAPGNVLNVVIPLYEAVARAVASTILHLAGSETWQLELQQEADQYEDPFAHAAGRSTLLHRGWLEALRLTPPTANQTRTVVAVNELGLPVDADVLVAWGLFHHDERVWGQRALEYDPDRWTDATVEQQRYFNPFGWGPQRCVAEHYANAAGKAFVMALLGGTELHSINLGRPAMECDLGYERGPRPARLGISSREPACRRTASQTHPKPRRLVPAAD